MGTLVLVLGRISDAPAGGVWKTSSFLLDQGYYEARDMTHSQGDLVQVSTIATKSRVATMICLALLATLTLR